MFFAKNKRKKVKQLTQKEITDRLSLSARFFEFSDYGSKIIMILYHIIAFLFVLYYLPMYITIILAISWIFYTITTFLTYVVLPKKKECMDAYLKEHGIERTVGQTDEQWENFKQEYM